MLITGILNLIRKTNEINYKINHCSVFRHFFNMLKLILSSFLLIGLIQQINCGIFGLLSYGVCQSGCNVAYVGCLAPLGVVAGR